MQPAADAACCCQHQKYKADSACMLYYGLLHFDAVVLTATWSAGTGAIGKLLLHALHSPALQAMQVSDVCTECGHCDICMLVIYEQFLYNILLSASILTTTGLVANLPVATLLVALF